MDDLKPHTHYDEGDGSTHSACEEMIRKYGAKAVCCTCTGHACKSLTEVETQLWQDLYNAIKPGKEKI